VSRRGAFPGWLSVAAPTLVVAALVAAAVVRIPGRKAGPVSYVERRSLLGTRVTLTIAARDEAAGKEHAAAAFERIAEIEKRLTSWSPDSELNVALAKAVRGPVEISGDLFAALKAGVEWRGRTRGAFDITVSPLIALWRKCGKEDRLPTDAELSSARGRLGIDRIRLDEAARTVRLASGEVRADLGGLGKGYCADEVTKLLKGRGVRSALVAVAGDIFALGTRPDGKPWRVGVQDPRSPNSPQALLTVLELSDKAVSTSGNYERYVEIQGRRYSHIVDPRTGRTAESVPSVTVIGPDTLTTDILGTALSVLGVDEGLTLVESMPGVEAMFVTLEPGREPRFVRSSGFSRYEAQGAPGTDYRR